MLFPGFAIGTYVAGGGLKCGLEMGDNFSIIEGIDMLSCSVVLSALAF